MSTASTDDRSIRVFVSSTFRDMGAERDLLTKEVFPEIRSLCEERGVIFTEVDLRWGVTDEEAAEGAVLDICLAEIENCRPYFIGLLGERYGWVPDELSKETVRRHPWLEGHFDRSVTELEILYGVLKDPDMAGHSFFYMRDPSYIDQVPSEIRSDFVETPVDRQRKLTELKLAIRAANFPVRDYPDPRAAAELIRGDLIALVDRLFPENERLDSLLNETLQHEAHAQSRARVYVERPGYFEALDSFFEDPNRATITVLGESGLGKSALLASWALRHRRTNPEDLALMHFIGTSTQSAEPQAILRRLIGELAKVSEIEPDKEIADLAGLRTEFSRQLYAVGMKRKVVLVLDALNQLRDEEGAAELSFLPTELPDGVKVIVSTLPGDALGALERRAWLESPIRVQPLEQVERTELIDRFLAEHTKHLDAEKTELISSSRNAANPLYLRAVLDELRVFGSHDQLGQRIEELLATETIPDLFEEILARYETDYEGAREGLVGDAMTLIWASRAGLAEPELLELLGELDEEGKPVPLPLAMWAPLRHAASELLVDHAARLDLGHDYLRQAIEDRYLPAPQDRRQVHRRLANYFETRGPVPRSLEETPFQLAEAEEWEQLARMLAVPDWQSALWIRSNSEVTRLWTRIEAKSELRATDILMASIRSEELNEDVADRVNMTAVVLSGLGNFDEAIKLHQVQERLCREFDDPTGLQLSLGNLALIYRDRGELVQAMELLEEQERICRELGEAEGLRRSLVNQALIHQDRGESDRAMELLREQELVCRELGEAYELQHSLGSQASIHHGRGEHDRAMELFREQERICRELGDPSELQRSLGNQAVIHKDRGEFDKAMELFKEQEQFCRELGDPTTLQYSLGNQAAIHHHLGELDRAMQLLREKERICRELDAPRSLSYSLGEQALIHRDHGDLDRAMELLREQERISRKLGNPDGLQRSLGNQALIHLDRRAFDRAMELLKEQERICRELGDQASLSSSLGNQAIILMRRGETDRAMELLREQERICREIRQPVRLLLLLGNQALIHQARGELDLAMDLLLEQEQICRELGDPASLSISLGNQALIHRDLGELDRAMELLKEQERIGRELAKPVEQQISFGNQALIHRDRGEFDQAMELLKKQERICRELGIPEGLQASLGNQALIHLHRGEVGTTLELISEREQILRETQNSQALEELLALKREIEEHLTKGHGEGEQ